MSSHIPPEPPSRAASAPCTSGQLDAVNNHQGKRVTVNDEPAIIAPTIPISGDPGHRVRVTFPDDPSPFEDAPDHVQGIIDELDFEEHS